MKMTCIYCVIAYDLDPSVQKAYLQMAQLMNSILGTINEQYSIFIILHVGAVTRQKLHTFVN